MDMRILTLTVPLAPLVGALIAGLLGSIIGRVWTHRVTIALMALSFAASLWIFRAVLNGYAADESVYTWLSVGAVRFEVGFLIDRLSALMMVVVTFVALMVHIYTIGYMHDDPGYQRFFSYISLFTFAMLMLVMANNFVQLFFGWEAVGLMSYLLIGFWYTRASAIYANLKAFLVNRVGDFGFLLGIGLVLAYFGELGYAQVFARAPELASRSIELFPGSPWLLMTVISLLLFVGAMGKSAQFPLHVWLPDSMEGPTPISALIHAATMVTAGIFMVARMSPLFELSETALSVVMVIGAITALFMALIAVVENDIKRVVAYSTLSQLGYMTVALGASAYAAGIFHLMTHAFFKALLFLGAGSVIIAMHHQQDMRSMGGLRKYMPITYVTMLIGSLASAGIPPLAGFFSKDAIIEAARASELPGAGFAYFSVLATVFVTAFYTFRLLFMTFHGAPRMDAHTREHLHESPWVITLPLIALAIPSMFTGWAYVEPMLFRGFFGAAIKVLPTHDVLARLGEEFGGAAVAVVHGLSAAPTWLALTGVAAAWLLYIKRPHLPAVLRQKAQHGLHHTREQIRLRHLQRLVLRRWRAQFGGRALALWRCCADRRRDSQRQREIDRLVVAPDAPFPVGFIYHYAFTMIIGVFALLTALWFGQFRNS